MDPASLPSWIQAGGVLAFAAAVWLELREQRRERAKTDKEHGTYLKEISDALAALLERERARDDLTPPLGTEASGYRKPSTPARGVDVVRIPTRRKTDPGENE